MTNEKCNFRNSDSEPHTGKSIFQLQCYTQRLEDYYTGKLGKTVTPVSILKTLAVISSGFKENNKLWILNVAPSRQLKSKTSEEQSKIFSKKLLVNIGSDFTIHGLIRDFGDSINNKCLMINDLTLLLASKANRTRARLIDALSELASEGKYTYSDFNHTLSITAKFSLITNITPSSFLRNKNSLLGNTFTERCLIVYHELTEEEMTEANLHREERSSLKIERFQPTIKEKDVKVSEKDVIKFNEYAKRWRILGAYTSSSALFDMIKSIAIAYAILSGHIEITSDEYRYFNSLEPYIHSPFEETKLKILEFAHKGKSIKEICEVLKHNYETFRPYVSKVINEYRRKGVLPLIVKKPKRTRKQVVKIV